MRANGRLFSHRELRGHLHKNLQKMTQAVDAWDPEKLLMTPEDDVIEELMSAFRIVVPTLDREGVSIEPVKQGYGTVERFGDSIRVTQNTITLLIPYTGDRAVFTLRPNPYMDPAPQGEVTDTEVRLVWTGQSTDHEFVRRALEERITEITKCLDWARANVNGYNTQIEQVIPQRVQARKQALLASRGLEASLGSRSASARTPTSTRSRWSARRSRPRPSGHPRVHPSSPSPCLPMQTTRTRCGC